MAVRDAVRSASLQRQARRWCWRRRPAQAELTLCNRTSYRMEAAIGLEKRANVETRGWFRIDPGACRQVVDGPLDVDMVYVHARTPSVYGSAPLPQNGNADFCIRDGDFDHCQRPRLSAQPAGAFHRGAAVRFAERADGQSRRRSRLRRRAGAARRHPAPAGDRRLRRQPDRRRRGRQDASRDRDNSSPTASCRPTRSASRTFFDTLIAARQSRRAPASPGATTPNIR